MADKDENGTEAAAAKKSRHRSPNYPSMGLRTAVGKIQLLYKAGGLAPLMKVTALQEIGFSKTDGNAARAISALRSFGLVEEVGEDRIKLTQRGVDIVARQEGDPRRAAALRVAGSGPQIYNELLTEYASTGIPPDAPLKSELIAAKRFNPNSVDGFLQDFRDTLEFAGISDGCVLDSKHEQSLHETPPVIPAVGNYVQWESAGQLQFPEPKRVRALSYDQQWAFVDGSDTGLPVSELTIMAIPTTIVDPPVDPPKPKKIEKSGALASEGAPKMRSYAWALSGDFNAKLDLFGEAQTEEDIDALADYVEITVKALKRSLKARQEQKDITQ